MKGFGAMVAGIGGLLLVITVFGHFIALGDYRNAEAREWEAFDENLARKLRSWHVFQTEAARRLVDVPGRGGVKKS